MVHPSAPGLKASARAPQHGLRLYWSSSGKGRLGCPSLLRNAAPALGPLNQPLLALLVVERAVGREMGIVQDQQGVGIGCGGGTEGQIDIAGPQDVEPV